MSQMYKLPSGALTRDQHDYLDKWQRLWQKAEAAFPGYKCTGYDPCLIMDLKDKKENRYPSTQFVLPIEAALALRSLSTVVTKKVGA